MQLYIRRPSCLGLFHTKTGTEISLCINEEKSFRIPGCSMVEETSFPYLQLSYHVEFYIQTVLRQGTFGSHIYSNVLVVERRENSIQHKQGGILKGSRVAKYSFLFQIDVIE